MKKYILTLIFLISINSFSQNYYFPPIGNEDWEVIQQGELNWYQKDVDKLIDFCDTTGTKGLIILKDGKIALEQYFGDFAAESLWYWASAGKSLTSVMIGLAEQNDDLSIDDETNKYLGYGWTKMEQSKEDAITIRHQLTMTTGINYKVTDKDCLDPDCLDYLNEPGTHWYYHNAPYRLLLDVLESVYDKPINQVTNDLIGGKIGMKGFWLNYVRWGRARDLARFGSFVCAGGRWGSGFLLNSTYYDAMKSTSQQMNPAYGYLWWLNGKSTYRLPLLEFDYKGSLVESAPDDMFAALGKNDQKIYIVPSENMVIVRIGEAGGESLFAASNYDDKLWERLSKLLVKTEIPAMSNQQNIIYPNPAQDYLNIDYVQSKIEIIDLLGNLKMESENKSKVDISNLTSGSYVVVIKNKSGEIIHSQLIQKMK